MTSSAEPLLLDTSAAVPLVLTTHEHHGTSLAAVGRRPLGLSGHAAFEVFSVLTRLPAPARLLPGDAVRLLDRTFPETRQLGARQAARLLGSLDRLGVAGGAVYDALVGATAVEHELELLSRDRRAAGTYRELGVRLRLL